MKSSDKAGNILSDHSPSRIIVADDHSIIRRGLALILAQTEDLIPAGDAGSTDQLFRMLRSDRFDLVVMNLSFDRSGIDAGIIRYALLNDLI